MILHELNRHLLYLTKCKLNFHWLLCKEGLLAYSNVLIPCCISIGWLTFSYLSKFLEQKDRLPFFFSCSFHLKAFYNQITRKLNGVLLLVERTRVLNPNTQCRFQRLQYRYNIHFIYIKRSNNKE